jgi:hypothetical protein
MNVHLSLWVALATPVTFNTTYAQQSFFFDESLHQIAVSLQQNEKLTKIEDRLNEEVVLLQERLRTTQHGLRQQLFERNRALEAVLTPDQLKTLNEKRRDESIKRGNANAEFLVKFAKYLKAISSANDLLIYEGLPRATEQEIEKIKQANKTIEIDDWIFYAEVLPGNSSIVETLRASLVDYQSFKPYEGGKFCGGFHPDFCVEWKADGRAYYMLICLGCSESVFITPTDKTTFDFNDAAWKSFAQIAMSTFTKHADSIKKLDEMIGQ